MIKLLGKFLTWLYWRIVLFDRWLQDDIDWKANYLKKQREKIKGNKK